MIQGRWGHSVVDKMDQIFIFGGKTSDNVLRSDLWSFNDKVGWTEIHPNNGVPGPSARAFQDVTTDVDCLYLFGGIDTDHCALDDLWKYNLTDHKWSEIKSQTQHNGVCLEDKSRGADSSMLLWSMGISIITSVTMTICGLYTFHKMEISHFTKDGAPWERHSNDVELDICQ